MSLQNVPTGYMDELAPVASRDLHHLQNLWQHMATAEGVLSVWDLLAWLHSADILRSCGGFKKIILKLPGHFLHVQEQLDLVSLNACSESGANILPVHGPAIHAKQQLNLVSLQPCNGLGAKSFPVYIWDEHTCEAASAKGHLILLQ